MFFARLLNLVLAVPSLLPAHARFHALIPKPKTSDRDSAGRPPRRKVRRLVPLPLREAAEEDQSYQGDDESDPPMSEQDRKHDPDDDEDSPEAESACPSVHVRPLSCVFVSRYNVAAGGQGSGIGGRGERRPGVNGWRSFPAIRARRTSYPPVSERSDGLAGPGGPGLELGNAEI
jgi:hypothetical protein